MITNMPPCRSQAIQKKKHSLEVGNKATAKIDRKAFAEIDSMMFWEIGYKNAAFHSIRQEAAMWAIEAEFVRLNAHFNKINSFSL